MEWTPRFQPRAVVGLHPIAKPPPSAQSERWHPCRSRCKRFLEHAARQTSERSKTANQKAIEHEKQNASQPGHPFKPRLGSSLAIWAPVQAQSAEPAVEK